MTLTPMQEELCRQSEWDFSDLRALFINCTLKRSPEVSNTEGLARISMEIMRRQGVEVIISCSFRFGRTEGFLGRNVLLGRRRFNCSIVCRRAMTARRRSRPRMRRRRRGCGR